MFREIQKELEELCAKYGVKVPTLLLNSRFRTTAGRFKYWRDKSKPPLIEIAKNHLEGFGVEETKRVLRHEFAHYYQWLTTGKTGHDSSFKDLCQAVGGSMPHQMAGRRWSRCASSAFHTTPFKYLYTCGGCQKKVKRRRKIPEKMICATCGTSVKRWAVKEVGC